MTWKEIKDIAFFIFVWILGIKLIEYKAGDLLLDLAGDVFGTVGLMLVAVKKALENEE